MRLQMVSFSAIIAAALLFVGHPAPAVAYGPGGNVKVLRGESTFADYQNEKPGTFREITVADLPQPYATKSVDNPPGISPRPANAWPQAPAGFRVNLYAGGLKNPREIRFAPNGDLFVAESYPGRILVYRGTGPDGKFRQMSVFASGLTLPFGIAFYPPGKNPKYVYIANTDSVIRFPYENGDFKARGSPEIVVAKIPGYGRLRGGRPLDTRPRIFARRQKALHLGGIALEHR